MSQAARQHPDPDVRKFQDAIIKKQREILDPDAEYFKAFAAEMHEAFGNERASKVMDSTYRRLGVQPLKRKFKFKDKLTAGMMIVLCTDNGAYAERVNDTEVKVKYWPNIKNTIERAHRFLYKYKRAYRFGEQPFVMQKPEPPEIVW